MVWYGAYPQLLVDHRGAEAETMIEDIESAVAAYPWRTAYCLWSGSQQQYLRGVGGPMGSCVASGFAPTAIDEDYLSWTTFIDPAPSDKGWQVSLLRLVGVTVDRDENME